MTISKRNIFFTFLLNLIVIMSMMVSGIFIATLVQGGGSYIIPIIAGLFIPLGASVLFASHRFLESIVAIAIDFFIVLILFKYFPFTSEVFTQVTLVTFLLTVVIGSMIGVIIKREVSLGKGYFSIIVAYCIIILVTTVVLASSVEYKNISDFFYSGYENLREAYNSIYTPELKGKYAIEELFTADEFIRFIPSMIVEMIFFVSFIYYFITKKILESINYKVGKIKPFKEFYISNLIGAVVILTICISLIFRNYGYEQGDVIAITGFTVIKLLLSITGAAFIYDKFINILKIKKVTTIVIIIVTIYIMPVVVYIVGFIELIFDFRRLDPHGIFKRKRG